MGTRETLFTLAAATCAVLLLHSSPVRASRAQSSDRPADRGNAFVGAWTRSHELSDQPAVDAPDGRGEGQGRAGGRRGYGGGVGGGGGFGGGRRGGRGGFAGDRDAMVRMREAMRDLMNPPDHLVIVEAGTMVILTGPDGRTTRLSTDGVKIKDESTGIERKTTWDGNKLVSEINGAGPRKIVQTFTVDRELHHLTIELQREDRAGQKQTAKTVYVADERRAS